MGRGRDRSMVREGGWWMLSEVTERRGGKCGGRLFSWMGMVGGSEPEGDGSEDVRILVDTVGKRTHWGLVSPPPSSAVKSSTIRPDMSILSSTPAATYIK